MGGIFCVPENEDLVVYAFYGDTGLSVSLLSSSICHIDAHVQYENQTICRFTRFYSHHIQTLRCHSWELLHRLSEVEEGRGFSVMISMRSLILVRNQRTVSDLLHRLKSLEVLLKM